MTITPRKLWHNKSGTFYVNRQHRGVAMTGSKSPRYRGGTKRQPYGPGWAALCRQIRKRDVACQHCGKTKEANKTALDVHHKVPFRATQDNNPENLTALCKSCHRKATIKELAMYGEEVHLPKHRSVACIQCGNLFEVDSYFTRVCSPSCKADRLRQQSRESYERKGSAAYSKVRHDRRRAKLPEKPPVQPRPCQECGTAFTPENPRAVFCTATCKASYKRVAALRSYYRNRAI